MASGSNLEKLFAGSGKVHTNNFDSIVTVNWNRSNYERIVAKLDNIINKTTIRKMIERAAKRAADAGVKATKTEIASDTTLKPAQIGNSVKAYAHGSALGMAVGVKIRTPPVRYPISLLIRKNRNQKQLPLLKFIKAIKQN